MTNKLTKEEIKLIFEKLDKIQTDSLNLAIKLTDLVTEVKQKYGLTDC